MLFTKNTKIYLFSKTCKAFAPILLIYAAAALAITMISAAAAYKILQTDLSLFMLIVLVIFAGVLVIGGYNYLKKNKKI